MRTLEAITAVYEGSNGDQTRALYRELEGLGPVGTVAVNLFRAHKTSGRAKDYRGGDRRGSYRKQSYATKEWSLGNLVAALTTDDVGLVWGWAIDEALRMRDDPHHHVLYVDLPTGQVSFHTGQRMGDRLYPGVWDGARKMGAKRICAWVAGLLDPSFVMVKIEPLPAAPEQQEMLA